MSASCAAENPPQFAAADPFAPKHVVGLFEAGAQFGQVQLAK
jgi:hypothetical protein